MESNCFTPRRGEGNCPIIESAPKRDFSSTRACSCSHGGLGLQSLVRLSRQHGVSGGNSGKTRTTNLSTETREVANVSGKRIQRYGRHGVRAFFIACWAILTIFGLANALAPARHDPAIVHGIGIAMTILCGFFLMRSLRLATIDIYPDVVVVNGIVQSRKFSLEDIDGFTTVRRVNLWGVTGSALALRTRDGNTKVFGEFWSAPGASHFSVEKVAEELNGWIAARVD